MFQSAARIVASLTKVTNIIIVAARVSIRRADRCLTDMASADDVWQAYKKKFQSAARIVASLTENDIARVFSAYDVSIRRADRCLTDQMFFANRACYKLMVSIRRADRCLTDVLGGKSCYTPHCRFNPPRGSLPH